MVPASPQADLEADDVFSALSALRSEDADFVLGILSYLPDPMIFAKARGDIVWMNRAAEAMLGHETVSGRGPWPLSLVELFGDEIRPALESSHADSVPRSCAIRWQRLGLSREFDVRVTGLTVPKMDDMRFVSIQDVSHHRQLDRMRTDFIAAVSHELRTPLASIQGFVETLMDTGRDDTQARNRFLKIMEGQVTRMGRLLNDLLSLSNIELAETLPPTDSVELSPLLHAVREGLAMQAQRREMTIRIRETNASVCGDAEQIHQVFSNLLENALRYANSRTVVQVDVRLCGDPHAPDVPDGFVSVSVVDQGEGIAPDKIHRLTERFYRVDKARSHSMGGTGLGLAIVKHIVSRHRGELRIESQLGEGSRFTVILPLARPS